MIIATNSRHSKTSIPKLRVLHIINTIEIKRIYNSIIAIMLFIEGAIKYGCNSNDLMFNIRNYSKFIFINIGIMATRIASIMFIKGYFNQIIGIIIIYRFMHIIIFFRRNIHSFKKFFDIDIMIIVFIAIFKYAKIFRFVKSNIILFNQRSNFISTLKSNKFFNLFNIKVTINTLCIRR